MIDYRAPCDAAATEPARRVVRRACSRTACSSTCPRHVIAACFAESRRILKPGGIVFHSVNCGDHYAYADRTIDQLHYLQYSDADVGALEQRVPLSESAARDRLHRARDARPGSSSRSIRRAPHPERLRQLDAIRVHPMFAHYTRDQLAITSVDFVARQPPRATVAVPRRFARADSPTV